MDKKTVEVHGSIKIVEIPYQVEIPQYKRVEKPEYVLVKEEVVYKVPKVLYENKTYEKPVLKEKEYIIPKYVEKEYIIPRYVEKEYERPVLKDKVYFVDVPKLVTKEQVRIIEKPVEVKVPKLVTEDAHVKNAIIENVPVKNAIIQHVTVDAVHPRYFCAKCRNEEVRP